MRTLSKYLSAVFLQPYVRKRMQRSTFYTWKDIRIFIPAGTFHPGYFFSTRYLLSFILKQRIAGTSLLELGAGNGLISIACAKAGAHVTATDINAKVLDALIDNALINHVHVEVLYSDLFTHIPQRTFDHIVINPPFYPKEARNDLERAWYCGADHAYFRALFAQLPQGMHAETAVWMILSEDCDRAQIETLAHEQGLRMHIADKKRSLWEWNYIYRIERP